MRNNNLSRTRRFPQQPPASRARPAAGKQESKPSDGLSSSEGISAPSESEINRIVQGLPDTELEAVTTLSSIEAAVLSALEVGNYDKVGMVRYICTKRN